MYSTSTIATTDAAYQFKFFPRYGKWTSELQSELDEHSRNMAKLMLHVQDLYKSKEQKIRDQKKEDTDSDCMGSAHFSQQSSGFPSRASSISPQPTHGHHALMVQYAPAPRAPMQQGYRPMYRQPIQGQFAPLVRQQGYVPKYN